MSCQQAQRGERTPCPVSRASVSYSPVGVRFAFLLLVSFAACTSIKSQPTLTILPSPPCPWDAAAGQGDACQFCDPLAHSCRNGLRCQVVACGPTETGSYLQSVIQCGPERIGSGTEGSVCQTDGDCADGFDCLYTCVRYCHTDADCKVGMQCTALAEGCTQVVMLGVCL
jgi:hypothetical protein